MNYPVVLKQLLNLVLPPRCSLCFADLPLEKELSLCSACEERMMEVPEPCCPTCGRPFPSDELHSIDPNFRCGDCRIRPPELDGARALLYFDGPVRDAIHLFKYAGYWRMGRALVRRLRSQVQRLSWEFDSILPIPLDFLRLRMRGFNQAVVLAREISKLEGVPLHLDLIVRTKRVRPQVGLKGKERLRNIRGSFSVAKRESVEGKKILLVDDVLTTGATANECARVLKKQGAGSVRLLALAGTYTPPDIL